MYVGKYEMHFEGFSEQVEMRTFGGHFPPASHRISTNLIFADNVNALYLFCLFKNSKSTAKL